MGPTGSGKSTFIEALAGKDQSLGISKDQLAGFTQEVHAYELKNAEAQWGVGSYPIYIIDTPGFSDSKMSEWEIINKVKKWMQDQRVYWLQFVFYLYPITDTRVPGSKRRTMEMVQSLISGGDAPSRTAPVVTLVTTMWDNLINPRARERSEKHFSQLQTDRWQRFIRGGGKIAKFQNTQESALNIIATAIEERSVNRPFYRTAIQDTCPPAPFLYRDLLDRINNSQQQKATLMQDHIELHTRPNLELEAVIIPRLQEVQQDLVKFLDELLAFGPPPQVFKGVPEQVVSQQLLHHIEEAQAEKHALQLALAQLAARPDPERKALLKSRVKEVQAKINQLAKYLDSTGFPVCLSDNKALKQDVLRPRVSFKKRVQGEVDTLRKKLTWN